MAAIEIRKQQMFDQWVWSCAVCHYGYDIPWERSASWADAMADVDSHLELHRIVGARLEWAAVL